MYITTEGVKSERAIVNIKISNFKIWIQKFFKINNNQQNKIK